MKILISGSRGLVGKRLTQHFSEAGSTVVPITRTHTDEPLSDAVAWNPASGWFDTKAMEQADVVIHLAGDNIADGLWTRKKKQRITTSRIQGTAHLAEALSQLKSPPKTFFCASATGFYGTKVFDPATESSPPGKGFLAETCQAWETEALRVQERGIRTILLRFGVILDPAGGALKKMWLPFRLGLGGRIGKGRQYFPWIAAPEIPPILDFLIHKAPDAQGPINIVAPQAVTNAQFTQTLARYLHRPAVIPVPAILIRLALGEMGRETLLASGHIHPEKLTTLGYPFHYPQLTQALDSTS